MKISEKDLEGKKYSLIREIDGANLESVEEIINKYGYPSKSIVGEAAKKTIFYVIQHSKKIDKYLPLIRKATKKWRCSYNFLGVNGGPKFNVQRSRANLWNPDKRTNQQKRRVDLLLWPIKMLIQSIFEEKKLGFNKQSRNMQKRWTLNLSYIK
jgi:hypothetical protein